MNKAVDIIESDNGLIVTGVLNFDTVPALYALGCSLIEKTTTDIQIDFSKVMYGDSAGLALLINWIRFAKSKKKTFCYVNIPAPMVEIARVCNLDKILALTS